MPRTLRVLLIEDSEFDAMLLTRMLRKGGYDLQDERIETADELQEALKRPWDVVIADYNLPQFSAPDALEIIQKAPTGRHKRRRGRGAETTAQRGPFCFTPLG